MCLLCGGILTPIVYGYLTGDLLNLSRSGEIIFGGNSKTSDSPNFWCKACMESFKID